MAKKKHSRAKKAVVEEHSASPFWPLTGAIVMFLLAFLLLLGGFGTGGALPVNLFRGAYWLLGWAGWLAPLALAYWGFYKFISEDHKIPLGKLTGMICLLVFSSSWLHVLFIRKDQFDAWAGGHGGNVGSAIGNLSLNALDRPAASIIFFVLALLALFFAFGISPKVLANIFKIFKREKDEADGEAEITDLADLKANAKPNFELSVKENVPVDHGLPEAEGVKNTTLKNTIKQLTPQENHEALTTVNDPNWKFPSLDLLNDKQGSAKVGDLHANGITIHDTFANFNYEVEMQAANVGPRVTQYTLKPPSGVKLTKLTALENNLALDLGASSIRMEAPIPGEKLVGIEVPNVREATVRLHGILASDTWKKYDKPLRFAVGKDIAGKPVVASLEKMPHLLVAGQTNSGKSVMINAILTSLLYSNSPADLKLILVDPKRVELSPYDEIPHLLTGVITEPERCISALKWAVAEMERRYRTLAEDKKRNIDEYNEEKKDEGMPYIVIVIDELADLMMMAARDVEALIVRLAQKARAVGIHLILATQSPRVSVITGLIKSNIPARIAFTVSQEVDSRIIMDHSGAEKLLGRGDMLFVTAEHPKPMRVQGALIEGKEVQKVTDFLRMQAPPQYDDEVVSQQVIINGRGGIVADMGDATDEPVYKDAVRVVIEGGKASTSLLQRRLRIGYGKAARLIETMEEQGIVSSADGNRPREVLVSSMDEVFGGGPANTLDDDELN